MRQPPALRPKGTKSAYRSSSPPRNVLVDQVVDRLLDIHIGADHARLLQRDAGLEDRLALRRTDLVVGQLGALLELLVDDVVGRAWSTPMKIFFSSS